jgi:ABC-type amino acid transport substrate-binding protein
MKIKIGKLNRYLVNAICILGCAMPAFADTLKYNVSDTDPSGPHMLKMIQLALDHVDSKHKLEPVEAPMTQTRLIEDTLNGNLDIMWAGTSKELEEQLEPIRIPMYKGLLGHRLLIIRKGDQAKFDQVKNIEDLRKIPLGQGTAWIDTKILEANGLKIVKTMKYPNLFHMLDGGRFDAFPRAVFEPFSEVDKLPNLNLTVEKRLMLVYKMDSYLFVNKNNKQLARDLELGLNRAIADGSFEKVFLSAPSVQEAISKGDLKNRVVIPLDNPFNSKETPIDRAELWIDPNSL